MRASVCVGRVGGLAIALGIGAAVGGLGPGVAGASPTDSTASSSSTSEQPASAEVSRDRASAPGTRPRVGRTAPPQPSPTGRSSRLSGTETSAAADDVITPAAAAARRGSDERPAAIPAQTSLRVAELATDVIEDRPVEPAAVTPVPVEASAPDAVPLASDAATSLVSVMAASEVSPPVIAQAPPATVTVQTVVADSNGSLPVGPVESAVSWVVVAAARRDGRNRPSARSTRTVGTAAGQPLDGETVPAPAAAAGDGANVVQAVTPAAAVSSVDPITAIVQQIQPVISGIVGVITTVVNQVLTFIEGLFNPTTPVTNASPNVATPTVGLPDLTTGVIAGQLNATDADGDVLVFGGPTSTAKGTVAIDPSTGAFTYTPRDAARHEAAALDATAADKTDTLNFTVSDGKATATVAVSVAVRPLNSDPLATVRTDTHDTTAGVITGVALGSDSDGDKLTYSASAAAGGGRVVIDSNTGLFTYTSVARVDTVTTVIKGFSNPVDIVFSPDGSRAYVSNRDGNTVSVVDTATKTIVATITGFDSPSALTVTPDGSRLYVAGSTGVSVVDATTNRIAGSVSGLYAPAGGAPRPIDVAVSPTANVAYVLNSDGRALSVVDIATDRVITTITDLSSSMNHTVVFSPDGARAYVGSASLTAIDTATHTVIDTGFNWDSLDGKAIALSPQGDRIYTASYFGPLQVGDADLNRIARVEAPVDLQKGIAVSRDGSIVYALAVSGEIFLFDTATSSFVGSARYACGACSTTGRSPNGDQGIAVSPDGNSVYVADRSGTIKVLTRPVGLSPDSFTVTVTDGHGGSIVVPVTVSFD